jgi:hypothetical protein
MHGLVSIQFTEEQVKSTWLDMTKNFDENKDGLVQTASISTHDTTRREECHLHAYRANYPVQSAATLARVQNASLPTKQTVASTAPPPRSANPHAHDAMMARSLAHTQNLTRPEFQATEASVSRSFLPLLTVTPGRNPPAADHL